MDNDKYFNRLNAPRLEQRQVDELIGLARGLAADGELRDSEVEYLVRWLVANREIVNQPVVSTLYRRVQSMLSDGILDHEERTELLALLEGLASDPLELGESLKSTRIPFTTPNPILGFAGWRYCFTGTFNYGTRTECESAVTARGAMAGSLTQSTDALVVGHYATESWLHSSYGRKIMKASEMRDSGHHVVIVSEEHWRSNLAP